MSSEAKWAAILDAEHDNLRAALAFFRDTRRRAVSGAGRRARLVLARAVVPARRTRAPDRRTRGRAGRAGAPVAGAGRLWGDAYLHALRGDSANAMPLMEAGLQMWREVGTPEEVAGALEGLGWALLLAGRGREGVRQLRGEPPPPAADWATRISSIAPRSRSARRWSRSDGSTRRGRWQRRSSPSRTQHGNLRGEHSGWHYTADCALLEDNCAESLGALSDQPRRWRARPAIGSRSASKSRASRCRWPGSAHSERALRLGGAVEAEYERIGSTLRVKFWDALLTRYFGAAREALGDAAASRAWARGRATAFDEAVEDALRVD